MQILICPGNFNCVVKDLMTELKDRLSIVYPRFIYTKHTIYIRPDIEIRFARALSKRRVEDKLYNWCLCMKMNEVIEYEGKSF